jgi:hypothetical protein
MAATLAASLEITSLRSSVEDESPDEVCAAFKTYRLLAAFRRRGSVLIVFEGQNVLANLVDEP